MIFPEHQPIIFEPYLPDECGCNDAVFRLLAKSTDVCQFQVIIAPCGGTQNSLCNPDFSPSEFTCNNWVTTGGFTTDENKACCDEATGTISQQGSLVTGNIYQVSIIIASINGTLYVYNGVTEVAQITEVGETIFTFTSVSQDISLEIQDNAHSVCISTISARTISNNMGFGIINSSGVTVAVADVVNNPEHFTFTKDRATIKFTWSDFGVEDGQCYTIGFSDGCTNTNGQFGIFNEGFDSCLTGWTINPGTIPSITCEELENPESGQVENCIEFDNTGTGDITSFVTELKIGNTYLITIDAMSDDADGFLRVYCGTAFYDFTVSGESAGIICAGNTTFKIEAHLESATYIRLWGFTLTLSNINETEFDYESHAFKIGENECTHLLNLSNDDDGMGFVFTGANFAPQVRVESVLKNSVPEFIKENYHDNLGKKQNYYGEYRKHLILHIDYIPAWLFDFISLCFIADHFFIDGEEYFIEGDTLETSYPENVCFTNMTSVRMEVSKKTQLFRNANVGESNPVSFGGESLLADGNGNLVVDLFTQSAIDVPL